SAFRTVRGRRRGPVHLRLPRRHHPQHRGVRAGLPGRQGHPSGAELPPHPEHPGRGNAVVSQNRGRKPKNLWSDQDAGPPITGYVADNEHDEAAFVAEEVDRLTDAGQATPGQVAVFYRTNAQSRVFEEVFIRVGLPYRVVGGVRFYERREVRDLLAYLRLTANPADEASLRRVLNVPR